MSWGYANCPSCSACVGINAPGDIKCPVCGILWSPRSGSVGRCCLPESTVVSLRKESGEQMVVAILDKERDVNEYLSKYRSRLPESIGIDTRTITHGVPNTLSEEVMNFVYGYGNDLLAN